MGLGLSHYGLEGYGWIGALLLLFKGWMVMDAIRSGNDKMWFFIVFVPFGELIYFFTFKLPDFIPWYTLRGLIPKPKVPLKQLQRAATESPSIKNKELYVEGLMREREYSKALPLIEEMLQGTNENSLLLFQLALCLNASGNKKRAIEILTSLYDRNPALFDYQGSILLAQLESEMGDQEAAEKRLRAIASQNSRLEIKLQLAKTLAAHGKNLGEAQSLINTIIEDFRSSPSFYRRRNRAVFRSAKRLQRALR
jgi:hypothetical protein